MDGLRTRTLFSGRQLTVTAVESWAFQTDRTDQRSFLFGSLKPIAIIVTGPDSRYALDLDAQPLDIDQLDLPAGFEV